MGDFLPSLHQTQFLSNSDVRFYAWCGLWRMHSIDSSLPWLSNELQSVCSQIRIRGVAVSRTNWPTHSICLANLVAYSSACWGKRPSPKALLLKKRIAIPSPAMAASLRSGRFVLIISATIHDVHACAGGGGESITSIKDASSCMQ